VVFGEIFGELKTVIYKQILLSLMTEIVKQVLVEMVTGNLIYPQQNSPPKNVSNHKAYLFHASKTVSEVF